MKTLDKYGGKECHFSAAAKFPYLFPARIISHSKDIYQIATAKETFFAEVSGKLRYELKDTGTYPCVGDFVMVDRINNADGNAIIHNVLPRTSCFQRMTAGNEEKQQIIAANIDFAFLCMSLNRDYNLNRLERYLSIAWESGAMPVIILTKADLCPNIDHCISEISAIAPGIDVITTSKFDKATVALLESYLRPGVTVSFIGSSGVGKSTLINCLLGEEHFATNEIRNDDKGRHTTTRRELLLLPNDSIVIDTPGMRELSIRQGDLGTTFSDIEGLAAECRFRDCSHTAEQGCSVLAAIENQSLDPRRLENYKKLQKEMRYESMNAKEIETEKLNSMFKEVGGMKNSRKFARQSNKSRR